MSFLGNDNTFTEQRNIESLLKQNKSLLYLNFEPTCNMLNRKDTINEFFGLALSKRLDFQNNISNIKEIYIIKNQLKWLLEQHCLEDLLSDLGLSKYLNISDEQKERCSKLLKSIAEFMEESNIQNTLIKDQNNDDLALHALDLTLSGDDTELLIQ